MFGFEFIVAESKPNNADSSIPSGYNSQSNPSAQSVNPTSSASSRGTGTKVSRLLVIGVVAVVIIAYFGYSKFTVNKTSVSSNRQGLTLGLGNYECTGYAGFTCDIQSINSNNNTDSITLSISQNSGSNWTDVKFFLMNYSFYDQNYNLGIFPSYNVSLPALNNGSVAKITLSVPAISNKSSDYLVASYSTPDEPNATSSVTLGEIGSQIP